MYNLCMPLLNASRRRFLTAVSNLAYCNPFLTERTHWERAALGSEFTAKELVWSANVVDSDAPSANVEKLYARLGPELEAVREGLEQAGDASDSDLMVYEESVQYYLYERYHRRLCDAAGDWRFYDSFVDDWRHYFEIPGKRFEPGLRPEHAFACFRQVQRAFHLIFDHIIGNSMPAARLRASVWQSVFSHDLRRYRRTFYGKMQDFPTLITGPSGTGKELVARAVAGSRYVPFDGVRRRFADPPGETFLPINLAALSPALIESELFGHRRGSFTGAISDRKGWLDACPAAGSVFLDELGEMDLSVQVKLLRVLETRKFSAVGDTVVRTFLGKLIAATNRDLPVEIRAGRFREDLYYRLCADQIQTPSLREQIEDSADVLRDLLHFMVKRTVGDDAGECVEEVRQWVRKNLPRDYGWPGNYRELEQCVRNILIRRTYTPVREQAAADEFYDRYRAGELKSAELLSHYAGLVYRKTGSYEEAARRLGVDRRTVKAWVIDRSAPASTIP
jgi:transcriptional regulator with AAA-type ATPase domain